MMGGCALRVRRSWGCLAFISSAALRAVGLGAEEPCHLKLHWVLCEKDYMSTQGGLGVSEWGWGAWLLNQVEVELVGFADQM